MARPTSITAIALLTLLALLLAVSLPLTAGQSYIPQVNHLTSCSTGNTYVTFGNNNVSALASKAQGTSALAHYVMTSYFNNSQMGTVISQLSLGLLDNTNIASVVHLRLVLLQVTGITLSVLGQTDEITLFPSTDQIIFANLLSPVTLNIGQFAIGFHADAVIYTGVDSVPTGRGVNAAYQSYTSYGLSTALTASYIYGYRALAAHGCVSDTNPFQAPNTQVYAFCAYVQRTDPPSVNTTYTYAAVTTTTTVSGVLAVSTSNTGTGSQGPYGVATGGYATFTTSSSGQYYYYSTIPASSKSALLGAGSVNSYNQQFYTNVNSPRVDNLGLSFVASDGTQFILSYVNGQYQIYNGAAHSAIAGSRAGFTAVPMTNGWDPTLIPTCQPSSSYVPDTFTCPSGATPIEIGVTERDDELGTYDSATSQAYGNMFYFREFTATTPRTTLYSLTWLLNDNPNHLINVRLGLFNSTLATSQQPTYNLIAQTREILIDNVPSVILKALLERPVELEMGRNYSIGVIADSFVFSSYIYAKISPYAYTYPYSSVVSPTTGMPSTVATQYTSQTLAVGGNACALQQTTVTYSVCAAFVYASYQNVYTGTLTVLNTRYSNSKGQYYIVIGGSGVSNQTYPSTRVSNVYNWTVSSYNLWTNNYLYPTGTTADHQPVDEFGLQIVVAGPSAFAMQWQAYPDAVSGLIKLKENQQYYYGTSYTSLVPIVATLTVQPYSGGAQPACAVPPKPLNLVSPLTVKRALCPTIQDSIPITFGDVNLEDYPNRDPSSFMTPDVVHAQDFMAQVSATVRQLAVAILPNTNTQAAILVRMGIYSETNTLMAQTAQLSLTQVIDQVIVLDLLTAVNLTAGRSYKLAIISNAQINIATSASSGSPVMASIWSSTGLPTIFSQSGTDKAPSIAAYACGGSTHSFCGYTQYWTGSASVTTLISGLLQASTTTQTNARGTYYDILAAAGYITTYTRTSVLPASTIALNAFTTQRADNGNLYISGNNNLALDTDGFQVELASGQEVTIALNASTGFIQDSLTNSLGVPLLSGFSYLNIVNTVEIPNCNIAQLPSYNPPAPPAPQCEAGQLLVNYGDADQLDLTSNTEGVQYAPANQIYLREFTSHPTRTTVLSQISFGVNSNLNIVARIRLGLYSSAQKFIASTNDITAYNPDDVYLIADLTTPVILSPNTIYYLALWTDSAIYCGFNSISQPAGVYDFDTPWPTQFVSTATNSQRSLGGIACTTNSTVLPNNPISSSTGGATPVGQSSSSSGVSSGAVAGIVIGCVIGSNLLLFGCLYLFCVGALGKGTKGTKSDSSPYSRQVEESQVGGVDESRVEMGEVNTD